MPEDTPGFFFARYPNKIVYFIEIRDLGETGLRVFGVNEPLLGTEIKRWRTENCITDELLACGTPAAVIKELTEFRACVPLINMRHELLASASDDVLVVSYDSDSTDPQGIRMKNFLQAIMGLFRRRIVAIPSNVHISSVPMNELPTIAEGLLEIYKMRLEELSEKNS